MHVFFRLDQDFGKMSAARPLHYVMKIGDRRTAIDVLVNKLKMKVFSPCNC